MSALLGAAVVVIAVTVYEGAVLWMALRRVAREIRMRELARDEMMRAGLDVDDGPEFRRR